MGIFNFRKKKEVRSANLIKEYYGNDFNYLATIYAKSMYDIPEVRNAIETMSDIFSNIPMYHKRIDKNGNVTYLDDSMERILTLKPNLLQNGVQFWKSVITQLLTENNVFIEPIFNNIDGSLQELYPLPFKSFDFDLEKNNAYVQFYDSTKNSYKKYNLKDLIYLSRFCNLKGGLKSNLGLYETVLQALETQIVNVASPKQVRALLQGTGIGMGQLKEKDKNSTMKEVNANFDSNVNGLAYLDSMWKITPINWQQNDVNRDLMQFVINVVYNYFKINDSVINNKATEVEFEMFISNSIKPMARQIENELTSKLFTQREIEFGNRIELDTFALSISTLQAKTALFSVASRQGVLNIDEMREQIGQPPLPNGIGTMYRVSADTIDITKVNEYQAAQKGVSNTTETVVEDKNKEDVKDGEKK